MIVEKWSYHDHVLTLYRLFQCSATRTIFICVRIDSNLDQFMPLLRMYTLSTPFPNYTPPTKLTFIKGHILHIINTINITKPM